MPDVASLLDRIDAEFSSLDDRIKQAQAERQQQHRERQQRLATFEQELESLPALWKPRLEALLQRFGDRVKVTPHLAASSRAASLEFQSDLARIRLRLSAATDHDVRRLILNYDLEIIPVFIQFDSHKQADWPVEAIDRRGVIDVEAHHVRAESLVRVVVADDGPGIPPTERDKLFLPYYSTKRRGSGLGLAIVRRIVAEHGGSIDVTDNVPRGTRFTVELPC